VAGSVSVVIPCYNYGRYLRQCVQSVLAQDVDVEVSIIDDASTDDTELVGTTLASEDPRVVFQRHARNRGHIQTYNEGLRRAHGTYSLLLSADDMVAPGALHRAVEVLDSNPDAALLYGGALEFSDVPPSILDVSAPEVRIWPGQQFIRECCKEVWNPISTPTALVRTSAQKAVGGYRPSLPHAGDREMWLRLATQGNVAELRNSVQAFYRMHDRNMHKQWYYDFLVNERELRTAYEAFFTHSSQFIDDGDNLGRMCMQRVAERGIWWAYYKLRHLQVRQAFECLRFAGSVWHDQPEHELRLLDVRTFLAPLSYAIRERQRRRRGARRRFATASSSHA
jgi:glycosyltransferase involved in cell wall biosynthesis